MIKRKTFLNHRAPSKNHLKSIQAKRMPTHSLVQPLNFSNKYLSTPLSKKPTLAFAKTPSFCTLSTPPLKPKEIKVKKAERKLYITWQDNRTTNYLAEYLRVSTPSAENSGHPSFTRGSQYRVIAGKRGVEITKVQLVGNYAIRIIFSDLHDSGIYSFKYLNDLAEHKYQFMKAYLKELKAEGKSRDRKVLRSFKETK